MAMRIFTAAAVIALLAFLWLYYNYGLPVLLAGLILALLAGFVGVGALKKDNAQKRKWQ
ncbi:MAG: hypothetical protein HY394_03575 [Candidatus Diapherotrites archaeon]|nr:hypothetical protein [Candidatus Diapherotrites archaeon]